MAQQVEHVLGKDEVSGSSPDSSSTRESTLIYVLFFLIRAVAIAQLFVL